MSTIMYHINPNTGVPSRCYAKEGRCPYGGTSGMSNHYKTFTEAQAYAQEMMEDEYRMLPAQVAEYGYDLDEIDEMLEEKTNRDSHVVSEFLRLDKDSKIRMIRETDDTELLMGVVNGEIGNGDWEITGPALQNENVPKELLEEILFRYPDEFGVETRKWAVTNKSLTPDDLRVALGDKDREVRSLAFANGNLEKEFLNYAIHDKTPRQLGLLPYAMIFFDKRNEGVSWVEHLREGAETSDYYDRSIKTIEKLFDKYIKPNMDL